MTMNTKRTGFRLFAAVTLLAALFGLQGPASVAHAAGPWFVATTGNDTTNNCLTVGTPCLTIAHAISKASAGDTINIAPGTYNEHLTVDKSLTFVGAGAASGLTNKFCIVTYLAGVAVCLAMNMRLAHLQLKDHLTGRACWLRSNSQASSSSRRVHSSGMRRSKHWPVMALNSISAMLTHEACRGV